MSRYATLLDDGSDSDSDAAESAADGKQGQSRTDIVVQSADQKSSDAPRQSGGSYAQRADPITGVDWAGGGAPVDTGFSDADVQACIRVVTGLGEARSTAHWRINAQIYTYICI